MSTIQHIGGPTILVVFGGTGDLALKKIYPGLFSLHQDNLLPSLFTVIGVSRRARTNDQFRSEVARSLKAHRIPKAFLKHFTYEQGDVRDPATFQRLATRLGMVKGRWQFCANRLFYLAVPPADFPVIFHHLETTRLTEPCSPEEGYSRVLVEKPFGSDLETAKKLDAQMGRIFREDQIYRIDHYLTKETLQNILMVRFSNTFLEPIWNKKYIDSIRIQLLEDEGVGHRAAFYDKVGAIRDTGQNHLLQMVALIAMNRPRSLNPDDIRKERSRVFQALNPVQKDEYLLRAQYEGYRQHVGVAKNSQTETYFRVKTSLNLTSLRGVPFILESGKAVGQHRVDITVQLKEVTKKLFADEGALPNQIIFHVYPEEGAEITFLAKKPGYDLAVMPHAFSFMYDETSKQQQKLAHAKLLYDAIRGDRTLFASTREVMMSWRWIDSLLHAIKKTPLQYYQPGRRPE